MKKTRKNKKPLDRKAALARIHCCKRDLALDDSTYRQALVNVTGLDSCGKMSDGELIKVLDHFSKYVPEHRQAARKARKNAKSEANKGAKKSRTKPAKGGEAKESDKTLGWSHILMLIYWKARTFLGPTWRRRLTRLCESLNGKTAPEWCDADELLHLLAALSKIIDRESKQRNTQNG